MGLLWIYIFGVGCLFSKPLKALGADFQTAHVKTTYQTALETCRGQYNRSVALPRDADENDRLMKVATSQRSTVWLGATLTLFPWRFRRGQEAEYRPLENQGCFRSSNFTVKRNWTVTLSAHYGSTFQGCTNECWSTVGTYLSVNTDLNDNGKPSLSCSCSEKIDGTAIGKHVCPYRYTTSSDLWYSNYVEKGFTLARVYKRRGQGGSFDYYGCYRSRQKSITTYSMYLEVTSTVTELFYELCIDRCRTSDLKYAGIGAILQDRRFAIACSCSNSLKNSFQTNITFCPSIETERWQFTTINVYRVYHTHGFQADGDVYQFYVRDKDNARTCGYFTNRFVSQSLYSYHAGVGKTHCGDRLLAYCVTGSASGNTKWSNTYMAWSEAKEYCQGRGMSLSTINDAYTYHSSRFWSGPLKFWVALVGRTWEDHRGINTKDPCITIKYIFLCFDL